MNESLEEDRKPFHINITIQKRCVDDTEEKTTVNRINFTKPFQQVMIVPNEL